MPLDQCQVYSQAKQNVKIMFERKGQILKNSGFKQDRFKLHFVVYRDYDQGINRILQYSPFHGKLSQLIQELLWIKSMPVEEATMNELSRLDFGMLIRKTPNNLFHRQQQQQMLQLKLLSKLHHIETNIQAKQHGEQVNMVQQLIIKSNQINQKAEISVHALYLCKQQQGLKINRICVDQNFKIHRIINSENKNSVVAQMRDQQIFQLEIINDK